MVNPWRRVLFSYESLFELFHSPNRQNDRVWLTDRLQLVPTETVKFPGKLHVWGMMSYNGLSDLHIIPKGQSVNASYYIEEILCKTMLSSLQRDGEIGGVCERRLMPDMSSAIFQQDGAPAHTAKITQNWLKTNVPNFWTKDIWPPNSPDLSPIENL